MSLKLSVVQLKGGECALTASRHVSTVYVNGEELAPAFAKGWFFTKSFPETVENLVPERSVVAGFLLNEKIPETALTPREVGPDFFDHRDEEGEDEESEAYRKYRHLYEPVMEVVPEHKVPVEFEVEVLATLDATREENV